VYSTRLRINGIDAIRFFLSAKKLSFQSFTKIFLIPSASTSVISVSLFVAIKQPL